MKKIFDIGMYDGADTAYYLECGYQVVAVEANPALVADAKRRFADPIASGQVTCIHAAISPSGQQVELNLSGDDLGSSSLYSERVADRRPAGRISVPGVTLLQLFERHGVPEYLKVDIEGADRLCILALTVDKRPAFLSFEVGDDVDGLVAHVASIGFRHFKIINQNSFRELANQESLRDRIAHRLVRIMGFGEPRLIRRAGRFFVSGHSSGPLPWQSDGRWRSSDETLARLRAARASNRLQGWYDVHAAIAPARGS